MSQSGKSNNTKLIGSSKLIAKKRRVSGEYHESRQEFLLQIIQQSYIKLNEFVEQVGSKIFTRIDTEQNKFVYAYQKHLEKVTKQLQRLKEMQDIRDQKLASDKTIKHLQKQCIMFRQQAIRLHTQLEQTMEQCDIYKRKSEILESEIKKTQELLKKYMKKSKEAETGKSKMEEQLKQKIQLIDNWQKQHKDILQNMTQGQNTQHIDKTSIHRQTSIQIGSLKNRLQKLQQSQYKQKQYRPLTTQAQTIKQNSTNKKNFKNVKINIQNLTFFNNEDSIFKNEIVSAIQSKTDKNAKNNLKMVIQTSRQKDSSKQQINSSKQKTSKKTRNHSNFSLGNRTYRNLTYDGTTTNDEPDYSQLFINNQLELFQQIIQQIHKTRQNIFSVQKSSFSFPIRSNDSVDLIFNDNDILSLLRTIFTDIQITCEKLTVGTRYKAKNKNDKKNLAQLSSQLMKKIQKKKIHTENHEIQSKIVRQNEDLQNYYDSYLPINPSNQKEEGIGSRQQKKQQNFRKMNEMFNKKNFTKKERKRKYINNLQYNTSN